MTGRGDRNELRVAIGSLVVPASYDADAEGSEISVTWLASKSANQASGSLASGGHVRRPNAAPAPAITSTMLLGSIRAPARPVSACPSPRSAKVGA